MMKEGIIKDTFELILKEIQTILTLGYILMIGIGMLFNYKKYAAFGINIFEYADIWDFLIAPFEDYQIIVFTVVSALFPILLFQIDQAWKTKKPQWYSKVNFGLDKRSWFHPLRIVVFTVLVFLYVFRASDMYARGNKKIIEAQELVTIQFADNESIEGILIGKTNDSVFLLQAEEVKVIPFSSAIKMINL